MSSNKDIKKHIADLRNSLKLTQAEMADKIGISRQAYINLEHGKTSPINKQIVKIAESCGISEEKILFGYSHDELSTNMLQENAVLQEKMDRIIKEKDVIIADLKERLDILTELNFSERQNVKTQGMLIEELQREIDRLVQENYNLKRGRK